ncbi:N-acetylmuramic acid 6-phosphate etherase [Metabacillus fastidiosus]|uniref:N-acetylmuramic acid 6-phosphate etherase n=1 Tax=Metabacillus fastidiosus TaxID=1458 RepID=UPI003D2A0788
MSLSLNLPRLTTEKRNQKTYDLDILEIKQALKIMNEEDQKVADAVKDMLPQIEVAIKEIVRRMKSGGRLLYLGAGTSGRLGILDAVECKPTFGVDDNMVKGIIAGGHNAMFHASEGSEDDEKQGKADLKEQGISSKDILLGIAASGRTPYVLGALKEANREGAYTISLTCNQNSVISEYAQCAIEVVVGPEILTGSTRLKSATAQKMVLNMISTISMVQLGKVYQNLMVDVDVINSKLQQRAIQIIMEATNTSYEKAKEVMNLSGNNVKCAIVMIEARCTLQEAILAIQLADEFTDKAITIAKNHSNES